MHASLCNSLWKKQNFLQVRLPLTAHKRSSDQVGMPGFYGRAHVHRRHVVAGLHRLPPRDREHDERADDADAHQRGSAHLPSRMHACKAGSSLFISSQAQQRHKTDNRAACELEASLRTRAPTTEMHPMCVYSTSFIAAARRQPKALCFKQPRNPQNEASTNSLALAGAQGRTRALCVWWPYTATSAHTSVKPYAESRSLWTTAMPACTGTEKPSAA